PPQQPPSAAGWRSALRGPGCEKVDAPPSAGRFSGPGTSFLVTDCCLRVLVFSEVAAREAGEGRGRKKRQVRDRPEHEPDAARVGTAERAEPQREGREPARVSRERIQAVLVERLGGEDPGRDPGDVLERVR